MKGTVHASFSDDRAGGPFHLTVRRRAARRECSFQHEKTGGLLTHFETGRYGDLSQ